MKISTKRFEDFRNFSMNKIKLKKEKEKKNGIDFNFYQQILMKFFDEKKKKEKPNKKKELN